MQSQNSKSGSILHCKTSFYKPKTFTGSPSSSCEITQSENSVFHQMLFMKGRKTPTQKGKAEPAKTIRSQKKRRKKPAITT
ncbi:hypothetical protein P170DRAFT_273403 [Aspergillus steynii IBT 23096]|uniref:Uncharacterized protein n=1 Tax=Aspergillus steynii IBT 23096 TaxID=1392250 RepID=A0A2I2FWX3_9EURO|nr:uncharacterized protein P170DRAFT_273403 [Aspergillus steynii IBT 23096]PLB45135.1 hypothetical protein P170DRAFT_273403 [Aspergillus steynii IBT 23096]